MDIPLSSVKLLSTNRHRRYDDTSKQLHLFDSVFSDLTIVSNSNEGDEPAITTDVSAGQGRLDSTNLPYREAGEDDRISADNLYATTAVRIALRPKLVQKEESENRASADLNRASMKQYDQHQQHKTIMPLIASFQYSDINDLSCSVNCYLESYCYEKSQTTQLAPPDKLSNDGQSNECTHCNSNEVIQAEKIHSISEWRKQTMNIVMNR